MTPIAKYFNLIPGKVYELYSDYTLTIDTDIRFFSQDHQTRIEYRELSIKNLYSWPKKIQ